MIKRTMMATFLGLAVASHAVLAQDLRSPAIPAPDRNVQQQPTSDARKQSEQKRLDDYWATHNDNAPSYPFNP
jgi:hypothetical protein